MFACEDVSQPSICAGVSFTLSIITANGGALISGELLAPGSMPWQLAQAALA